MLCSARSFASQPQRMKEELQHWEVFRSPQPWLLTGRGIGFFVARMPGWINTIRSFEYIPPSGEDGSLEINAEFINNDNICNQYLWLTVSSSSNNDISLCFYVFFLIVQSSLESDGTSRTLSVVFLSDFNEFKKLVGKFCGVIKKKKKR